MVQLEALRAIQYVVNGFTGILEFAFLIRVIMSWLPVDMSRGFPGIIYSITEPILYPIRNMINKSPIGGTMIDFSIVIAYLLVGVARNAILWVAYSIFVRL